MPLTVNASSQTVGNITFDFDSKTGVLTISGSGPINNYEHHPGIYDNPSYIPYYSSGIKSIVIEEGITGIGYEAFEGISTLTSVSLPESLKTISARTFTNCNSLKAVILPQGLTAIGNSAFSGCSAISSISFPDSLAKLPDEVCRICFGLEEVRLPKDLKAIPRYAFRGCKNLTKINLPDTLTNVGEEAFASCFKLSDIDPTFINEIGSYAFRGTAWETEFLNKAQNGAVFFNSSTLYSYKGETPETMVLRSGTTHIMSDVFRGKETLKSVTVESENIGSYAFAECPNLESVTLSDSVKTIGEGAFSGCTALKDIRLSEQITKIPVCAFTGDSSLVEIVIPENVQKIDFGAFNDCVNLKSVEVYSSNCVIKYSNDISTTPDGKHYWYDWYDDYSTAFTSEETQNYNKHYYRPFRNCKDVLIYSTVQFFTKICDTSDLTSGV